MTASKCLNPAFDEAMQGTVLRNWCDEKGLQSFLESKVGDSDQDTVRTILSRYPRLVNVRRGTSSADPWVIALAMQYQHGLLSSQKKNSTGDLVNPKIPDVCRGSRVLNGLT